MHQAIAIAIASVFQDKKVRKILVSIKYLSAILGPEMAAPIIWGPGKMRSFCRKTLHVHKIPRFGGGVFWAFGGGSADFINFHGREDFSEFFSGKVQIVSRTLSGLFLVGALDRPRKRKGTSRENPRTIPEQIGKIPEKSGKSQKGQKGKDKSRSGTSPPFEPPPLGGP